MSKLIQILNKIKFKSQKKFKIKTHSLFPNNITLGGSSNRNYQAEIKSQKMFIADKSTIATTRNDLTKKLTCDI